MDKKLLVRLAVPGFRRRKETIVSCHVKPLIRDCILQYAVFL
jgi:hypothetical protein